MSRPHLIPNAAQVARRAWSVRLSVLASVCAAVQQALPSVQDQLPPTAVLLINAGCALGTVLCGLGAAGARLVAQRGITPEE